MSEIIKKDLIYFTGFMAGGKSTIGSIIANTIGYDFIDIDKEIEKITNKRVTEIFQEFGEDYFRELEHKLLIDVSAKNKMVISLGGGTITIPDNFQLIRSKGLLIYLKSSVENIFKRLRYKSDRPIFMSKEGKWLRDDELKNRITELYKIREPYYTSADIIISTDNKRVGKTVDEIVKKIIPFIDLST